MAKVITNFKIKRTLKKALKNKQLFERIGRYSVKRIKDKAREGISLEGGKPHSFPSLTDSTIARREILALLNPSKIDKKNYNPDFSNVTMTGSLLNSVKFDLFKARAFGLGFRVKVDVDAKKKRKKLIGLRGKKLEEKTNAEIYDDLKSRGFGFLGMDEEGEAKIKKMIESQVRKALRKLRRK